MMKRPWLLAVPVLLCTASAAHAQEITFGFTGLVDSVTLPGSPFVPGQVVTGSFTFDGAAPDLDPSAEVGQYEAVVNFELSVPAAGYHATGVAGGSRGQITVLNDQDGVRDRYVADVSNPGQVVSGPDVGAYGLEFMTIVLRDPTTTAFLTDALPLSPPDLADFGDGTQVHLGFSGPLGFGLGFAAQLTSLTASSVTDLLTQLTQQVIGMNLQGGVNNSLDAKLATVVNALDDANDGNNVAAVNALHAFINAVEAQRGKKLSDAQADQLVAAAQGIIAALGG
jgi:hypothetical protein